MMDIKLEEIEKGFNNNNISSPSLTTEKKETYISNNNDNIDLDCVETCCTKFLVFIILYTLCFPIALCDLYYAYNGGLCVSQSNKNIAINLKDYLLVSGLYGICLIFITSCITCCCIKILSSINFKYYSKIYSIISFLFRISWNIIAGLIFWNYIDNSLCSNQIYNYIYTSLIIKYIYDIINLIMIYYI